MPAYSFQTLRESGYFRFKVVEPLWKWKFRASRLKRLENSEILTPNFTPWNNSWNWLRPCYQISYDFQTSCYFFALSDSTLTLLQGSITSSFLTVLVRLSCYNKIWQVGQFKQQNFIFHHFRRQEMQIESDSFFFFFSCWNFSFRLEEVCMSSCFILRGQRKEELISPSPYKGVHPSHVNSTLVASSKPRYLQIPAGIGALRCAFWETQVFRL